MLATAVDTLPGGPGWAYEFKWDGVRALLDVSDGGVSIRSRNGNEVSAAYPELVASAEGMDDALLDGEIVAFRGGRPSFELLQTRMHVRSAARARRLVIQAPVTFVVFDLLRRYGVDLTARSYVERRATLDRLLAEHPTWTSSPYFDDGAATEAAAHQHGLEGVLAKRLAAPYRPGVRSADWRKLRFVHTGDFVVVGWEAALERADELSSLLLGCYHDGELVYAGKVGSGLTSRSGAALRKRLSPCAECVLPEMPPTDAGWRVHWVLPELVVEVAFAVWTDEGRLRHPVFRRVREDKRAEEALGDA